MVSRDLKRREETSGENNRRCEGLKRETGTKLKLTAAPKPGADCQPDQDCRQRYIDGANSSRPRLKGRAKALWSGHRHRKKSCVVKPRNDAPGRDAKKKLSASFVPALKFAFIAEGLQYGTLRIPAPYAGAKRWTMMMSQSGLRLETARDFKSIVEDITSQRKFSGSLSSIERSMAIPRILADS